MKVKIKKLDDEETVLIWLSRNDRENADVMNEVRTYQDTYKNAVIFLSGESSLEDAVKMMLSCQASKHKRSGCINKIG